MSTSGPTEGAQIILETCDGSARQSWSWPTSGEMVVNKESNMCLDAGSPLPLPCQMPAYSSLPFCNMSLSMDTRVKDLVSRLTNTSKYGLFDNGSGGAPEVGLGPYQVRSSTSRRAHLFRQLLTLCVSTRSGGQRRCMVSLAARESASAAQCQPQPAFRKSVLLPCLSTRRCSVQLAPLLALRPGRWPTRSAQDSPSGVSVL